MPTNIRIELSGVSSLRKELQGIQKRMLDYAVVHAVKAECERLLAEMQARCPVDTGSLLKSLAVRVKSYDNGRVVIGLVGPRRGVHANPNNGNFPSRYAHIVELGSSRSAARPFMRPAWDAVAPTFVQELAAGLMAFAKLRGFTP